MKVAQVIVDIKAYSVDKVFDYFIPPQLDIVIGMRVVAPFGHRRIEGYVIDIVDEPTTTDIKLKALISVSEIQFLNAELIALAKEFSQRTASFTTSMLQAMLPKDITKRKIKRVEAITALKKIETTKAAKKQTEVLDYLITAQLPIALPFLRKLFGAAVIAKMLQNDFFEITQIEEEKLVPPQTKQQRQVVLRQEQEQVLATLKTGTEQCYLLKGVTGSGKTEIFLSYVDEILKQQKTAIVLVPEIGLTPQMIMRFEQRFGGENIAVLHSKLTAAARFEMWLKIKREQVKIVLGTRSAIFAPLQNIGVIIIDEEHDASYKQENMPTYSAKEVALWRATYHQAKVILASATPSLESFVRAQKGIYQLLELKERVMNEKRNIQIINMRQYIGSYEHRYFSAELLAGMQQALQQNEQIMLLLNRRGYAPMVQCQHCGYTPECQHCDTNLVYHKDKGKFICHYCQHEETASNICPQCQSKILMTGVGIQKIAEELQKHFPNTTILRADRDNIKTLADYHHVYETFNQGEAQILLGTQMIAKGFDFPNVTVVGVLETDQILHLPDLRAREKAFQLLTQVIGRAGRAEKAGVAFLQTYEPEHDLFVDILKDDYDDFANKELHSRQQFKNPPFWHVSDIIISSENMNEASQCANYIFNQIQPLNRFATIYAPAPTFLKKMNNRYHLHILLKYRDSQVVVKNIRLLMTHVVKKYPKARAYLQVNPINFS